MKKVKICTVATGKNIKEMLRQIKYLEQHSEYIEIRADYLEKIKEEDLDELKRSTKKKIIFTFRAKNEGGNSILSEQERWHLIFTALTKNFAYVDVELATLKKGFIPPESKSRIIISTHNFMSTPGLEELNAIINEAHTINKEAIVKIAAKVSSDEDLKVLVRVLLEKKINTDLIIVGMGDYGKSFRVFAPLLGSYLTYAASKFSSSAPGQLDFTAMQKIYKLIN